MELKTYVSSVVQVHLDDADRRTVSVVLSPAGFEECAELLGYPIQTKGLKTWFEAPMTRDRLKLQFVRGD